MNSDRFTFRTARFFPPLAGSLALGLAALGLAGLVAAAWAQTCTVEFATPALTVREAIGIASLEVHRAGDTNLAVTVGFATSPGTATAGADYAATNGTLHFAPGETNQTLIVAILDDGLVEDAETFQLLLSNPAGGAALGAQISATVTIADDELPTVVDASFNPGTGANNDVFALALQPDDKILIAGQFTAFNGTNRSRIARLHADGSLDLSFDPGTGANGDIYAVAVQTNGQVLIGGSFTAVNGTTLYRVARLNADGSVDPGFNVGVSVNNELRAIAVQPDGRIVIAGRFTSVAGEPRSRVARLNADGTLDTSFNPGAGANDHIRALALQSDGKVVIGGQFTTFNNTNRNRVARLNADGSLDLTFDVGTGASAELRAVAVQNDGTIYTSAASSSASMAPTAPAWPACRPMGRSTWALPRCRCWPASCGRWPCNRTARSGWAATRPAILCRRASASRGLTLTVRLILAFSQVAGRATTCSPSRSNRTGGCWWAGSLTGCMTACADAWPGSGATAGRRRLSLPPRCSPSARSPVTR
jgi:uncharacterized delta-60 repeat protein